MSVSRKQVLGSCATLFAAATIGTFMAEAALAEGSGVAALEVFKDSSGRPYVLSNGHPQPHATQIYIDRMSGIRWIDSGHVILPFNNNLQ